MGYYSFFFCERPEYIAQTIVPKGHSSVVVGHCSQSMMGLSIDLSSVAMNHRTVRISKSKKKIELQELEITKMEVFPFLVV